MYCCLFCSAVTASKLHVFAIYPNFCMCISIGCIGYCLQVISWCLLYHSVHWGINPPSQKHHLLFLAKPPPLNWQTVQAPPPPFLGNPPPLYWFFVNPKNIKSSPSYLLKVTKFSGKISQFEFLVMTMKNIFANKLFLSLNISDLNLFFM